MACGMRMGRSHRAGRAIIGVIALYALLLQAFLGFATPSLALGPDGILCTVHESGQSDGKPATAHKHECCLPAHAGAFLPPPDGATDLAWRAPVSHILVWRPAFDVPTTGPPDTSHRPRGPPLA
jgi:hypothetical protein